MDKTIAEWQGEQHHYTIELSGHQIGLEAETGNLWDSIYMSRADVLAIIAGLQNAIAEMDDG